MTLRDYQQEWKAGVYEAWTQGARNVVGVMPTGGGKTKSFCNILQELNGSGCVIAHRQELVSQAALALAREDIPHGIIAPTAVIRQIVALEMDTFGRSLYNPRSAIRVAGVDTLSARGGESDRWFQSVQTVVVDEGHHVLAENKWGKALALFPAARGLFPTAHCLRADGRGLGRHADGLADALVTGPSCRELIDRGYLCDYRLICPPTDIDVHDVAVGESGEFNQKELRAAVHKSATIVGDVVRTYLQFAAGKLGLTFAVDLEAAREIAVAYNAQGVPAEIITANTPIAVRGQLMKRFRNRELLQLVSVDVLGEGTDVPAVEVVSMARHTASFQLYAQQFGRALRVLIGKELGDRWDTFTDDERKHHIANSSKPRAFIIDHVRNWERHLPLPDMPRGYTLDRREKRKKKDADAIPMRTCLGEECYQPYERFLAACPYCGEPAPAPAGRGAPEYVEGNLFELDEETLKRLRGEIARVDSIVPQVPQGLPPAAVGAIHKNHQRRQRAQSDLRGTIALWAGWQQHQGLEDAEAYRKFYMQFGVDVLTAQSLNAQDADALCSRISLQLSNANVVPL